MTKKTTTWFSLLVMLFIVFLGIVAVGAALNYFRHKVEDNASQPTTMNQPQEYISVDGQWTLNYPASWQLEEIDEQLIRLKDGQFKDIETDRGDIEVKVYKTRTIDQLIDDYYAMHEDIVEEVIAFGQTNGVRLDGKIRSDASQYFQPGSEDSVSYVQLNNKDVLSIRLYNQQKSNDYQNVLANLTIKPVEENMPVEEKQDSTVSNSGNVEVYTPIGGEKISSPYLLTGKARAFENVVNYELTDKEGNILADGFINAKAADVGQFGDFETSLVFVTPFDSGKLEVFTISAKDGSRQDIVSIKVKF